MKQLTRIRFLRAHRTLQEVAVGASVSKWTYWRWEQHPERLRKVDVDTLDRLAAALNATRGQLLGEEPIPGYVSLPAQPQSAADRIWSRDPDLWAPSTNGWPRVDHDGCNEGSEIEGCPECEHSDRLCMIHAQVAEGFDEDGVA